MSFAHPAILLLLWLVPLPGLLVIGLRHRRQRLTARLVHPALSNAHRAGGSETRFRVQLGLILLGLALLVVAAAGPRWGEREEIVLASGRNVLILLDVSRSMLATDVRPNRLERAKADLADLLAELRGDRAGIMAFRNGAVLLCPFTTDMAFLSQTLAGITIDSAPRGETDIGGGITAALATFKALDTDHNAIILISDGEDLTGQAVAAAAKARELGIPIFCVGIGDTQGSTIPTDDGVLTHRGETVLSRLDNQTLLDIATTSGGAYIPLQTAATGRTTLGTLYDRHVRNIIAREMQEMREARLVERFQYFLIPGLLAMIAASLLSVGRPSRRRRPTAIILLAACTLASAAGAGAAPDAAEPAVQAVSETTPDAAHHHARQAQRAARRGDDATAAEHYLAALAAMPADPELLRAIRFNAALSLLKTGHPEQAAEHFRTLADDPVWAVDASEGLGAALFHAANAFATRDPTADPATAAAETVRLLEAAASAVQTALRVHPADDRRRPNLAALADRPRLREAARTAAILARHGDTPPGELAQHLLDAQRRIYADAAVAFTNETPGRIAALEAVAERQRRAAEIWTPLRERLRDEAAAAITNETQLADFTFRLDTAKDQAESAAEALDNLDTGAMQAMRTSETTALQLLAMAAEPPGVLAESLLAQSNALARALAPTRPRQPIEDQQMAASLFNIFNERYGAWLDQFQVSAPPETFPDDPDFVPPPPLETDPEDIPNITAEIRKTIDDLVQQTLGSHALVQMDIFQNDVLLSDSARINAEQALANMNAIWDLLPRPPPQDQQQQSPDGNQDDQQQTDGQDGQDGQRDDTAHDGDDDQQEPPDAGSEDDETQPEPPRQPEDEGEPEAEDAPSEPEPQPEDTPETADAREAARILEDILEQERQREEARRRRQRTLPPRPGERDW